MFDSLHVKCPKCGHELEFQSKSGPCFLDSFKKNNLSPEVAIGMDGDVVRCQFCNKRILLICDIPTRVKIKLIITKERRFDYNGNYNPKHPYSIKRQKELEEIFKGSSKQKKK